MNLLLRLTQCSKINAWASSMLWNLMFVYSLSYMNYLESQNRQIKRFGYFQILYAMTFGPPVWPPSCLQYPYSHRSVDIYSYYMICLIISNVFMKRMTSMDLSASLTFVDDIFIYNKLIERKVSAFFCLSCFWACFYKF